jgi:hypothetical protein
MREQVIETGPRTPPADPAQADTLSAWSSLITGFELARKPSISLPLTSLDPTDYRYVSINYRLRFVIEFLRSALPPIRAATKETGCYPLFLRVVWPACAVVAVYRLV